MPLSLSTSSQFSGSQVFRLLFCDISSGGVSGSDGNHYRSYSQVESAFELAVTLACSTMEHVFWIIIISQFLLVSIYLKYPRRVIFARVLHTINHTLCEYVCALSVL